MHLPETYCHDPFSSIVPPRQDSGHARTRIPAVLFKPLGTEITGHEGASFQHRELNYFAMGLALTICLFIYLFICTSTEFSALIFTKHQFK